MDKIEKALTKLNSDEREKIQQIITSILAGDLKDLDVKKLKGRDSVYRVRKGKVRIIYSRKGNNFRLIAAERRSDNTY
ncbi:MAG: hypothetical protein A3B23_01560 [Candidatus Colwellbacteria bacterium RIFCSPLOWO2_01_FULL_48_10]|uniref:Plasmid stabilization protein n=1 Tax=Candidatus Colwellbacteria bacterium RIFCSPLOWO2_01_FULL_48_10 TaxID=1797690 RepID=A0A1G1Z398_9BACT|nr:MAG: hypothetical protein A3B23_01560 [Candidatus Colwellbacteria bacterium RIFCSPLOWO2_01_FULL_48_10]